MEFSARMTPTRLRHEPTWPPHILSRSRGARLTAHTMRVDETTTRQLHENEHVRNTIVLSLYRCYQKWGISQLTAWLLYVVCVWSSIQIWGCIGRFLDFAVSSGLSYPPQVKVVVPKCWIGECGPRWYVHWNLEMYWTIPWFYLHIYVSASS
jgi:hypothetical protein